MPTFRFTMVGMGTHVDGGYKPLVIDRVIPKTLREVAASCASNAWLVLEGDEGDIVVNTHMIGTVEPLSEGES